MAAPGAAFGHSPAAARMVAGGAAMLAGSVLVDSAMEHYRGSFANKAMVLPIAASTLAFGGDGLLALPRRQNAGGITATINAASAVTGAVGLGYHLYSITRKPGGLSWTNLFYQAPVGAPAALLISGALGGAAQALGRGIVFLGPLPLLSGQVLAGFTAFGILGSSAEAALLHFRGAYHNKFMWLPVALPPIAAALLARAAWTGRAGVLAGPALGVTAALGLIGSAFHVYGVSRNMGGLRNWRQNLLAGPPIPAPPAFTGLALAGLGALRLIRRHGGG